MMEFSAVNTIWVLLGAALVFFMQAGFAMVETGFTRAKNAGNIIMKNLMDFAIVYQCYHGFRLFFTVDADLRRALPLTNNQPIFAATLPVVKRHLWPVRRQAGIDAQPIAMAFQTQQ